MIDSRGGRPLLTAHSGCLGSVPNSLDYLGIALTSGVAYAEVDLRLSADRDLVLSHDPVEEGGVPFPRLDAIWTMSVGSGMGLNLDVKELRVLSVLARYLGSKPGDELRRVVITGCDEAWVRSWKTLVPEIPVLLNVLSQTPDRASGEDWEAQVVNTAMACGAAGLNVDHRVLSQQLCIQAHRKGLRVEVWTVNERVDMQRCFRWGIDGLTTDRPDLAHEILMKL